MLKQIGEVTGARYVAQIKLQGFTQGAFGLRIIETRYANVRLFLQIWDSSDGAIVWEGMQEMLYARDRITEEPVTFRVAVERTARSLVAKLP